MWRVASGVLLVSLLLPLEVMCLGENRKQRDDNKAAQTSGYVNHFVNARLVAGAVPGDWGNAKVGTVQGLIGHWGCLMDDGNGNLVFVKRSHHWWGMRLFFLVFHMYEPYYLKWSCTQDQSGALKIPYDNMAVLADGQELPVAQKLSGLTTLASAAATAAGATVVNTKTGLIAVSATGAVLLGFYLNKRTGNYIEIFYHRQETNIVGTGFYSGCTKESPCAFLDFQIIDPHDFWNTTALLSARTGFEFVSESATKTK